MSFRIRSFTEKDLPFLVNWLNEEYEKSYEFTPYREDDIKSPLKDGKTKIFIAEKNNRIVGSVAYLDSQWGELIRWLIVAEDPDKKAIENSLVKEAEKCVKGETVFTSVDDGSPEISEWAKRDYTAEGGLLHMTAHLTATKPLPPIPKGIILRSMNPSEEKEFVDAVNAGFERERLTVGAVEKWKKENPPFSEEWIHIAEHEGKIVSAVVSIPDTEYNTHFSGKRGYLGPAATLPDYRGKSLASALTRRAMNFLFEKGMDSVALYTSERNAQSMALLARLDFKISHNWKFMRKNLKT